MKLAYLIMAHQHPQQLRRLVDALDCEASSFFIHIDRKAALAPFVDAVGARPNVHFIPDRVSANWMGFSLVEATLRLLAAAVAQGFDYCTLLSGMDYPIKSNEQLLAFFEQAHEEYIAYWRLEDRPSWMHKVQFHYPVDLIKIRPWSTGTDKSYLRRLFWGRYFRYRGYLPRRKFLPGLVPHGGPDWWSLSFGCAQFILRYVDENPGFKRFYRTTASPGEMFFQTIILNSPFAERVHNRAAYEAWSADRPAGAKFVDRPMLPEASFHYRYADWSGEATGLREKPAVLDESDWERLKASDCHFARKLDPQRSAALLDLIDRELLGVAP